MSDDPDFKPLSLEEVTRLLGDKKVTMAAICGYEVLMSMVTALQISADVGAAKNYVTTTISGMRLPFDRAELTLYRPGGKTQQQLKGEADMRVMRALNLCDHILGIAEKHAGTAELRREYEHQRAKVRHLRSEIDP